MDDGKRWWREDWVIIDGGVVKDEIVLQLLTLHRCDHAEGAVFEADSGRRRIAAARLCCTLLSC